LKNNIKDPKENFEKVVSLIEKKLQECTSELETTIQESKRINYFFSSFIENAQIPIFLKNTDGIYELVNKYYENLFGLDRNEILGGNDHNVQPNNPELVNNLIEHDKKVLETKKAIIFEEIVNAKGKLRKYKTVKFPLYDDKGELVLVGGVALDVTELEKTEQKLRESERKYRILFEQGPDMIFIIDPENGLISESNNRSFDILGYTPQEVKNKKLSDLEAKESKIEIKQHIGKILCEGEDFFETQHKSKSGKIKDILVSVRAINIRGKIYLQAYCRDITQKKIVEQKLKESEEKFRNITEQSLMAIGIFQDGVFKFINQRGAEMVGYSIEEMLNLQPYDVSKVFHPDDVVFLLDQIKKAMMDDGKTVFRSNVRCIKKDGDQIYVEYFTRKIIYEGNPAILVNLIDITALKESEEKFRIISEDSIVGIAILQDFIFTYANQRALDMFGYTEDEVKSWVAGDFLNIIHPEDRRRVAKQVMGQHLELEESLIHNPFRGIKKNGEIIWIDMYANSVILNNKPAVLGVFIDFTDQVNAENKLRESEEKYRNLIETSSMGLFEIDNNTKRLVYINPRLLEILEYSEEELLELENFTRLVHAEDLNEILSSTQERKLEFRIFSKSGKPRWLFGDRVHYYDEKGDLTNVRFWLQDITEKKELEVIKSNLMTRFSHEFKTPLISIKGFSDLLLLEYKDKLDEKINSFLARIQDGSERLKSLIDSFIELSHLEEKIEEVSFIRTDFSKLIKIIVNEMEGIIKLREHEITLNVQKNLIATVDEKKIRILISNLILNAINFTPKGGRISITANFKKDHITISVEDNGIGISEEEKSKLFKPFGKIERYGKGWDIIPDGMGMGLFISKGISELHGGKLWVESEGINKGSTFYFSLPILNKNKLKGGID
jgi:PAS domain S-box-containing protein